ncbi:MAG: metal-sensing transcriptional repressor [Pseudomonadota bacterium]
MNSVSKAGGVGRRPSVGGPGRGIQRKVEQDQYCIDVIKQISAVQAALSKMQQIILDDHLHSCVTTAIRGDDAERREAVIDEILGVFSIANT